MAIKEFISANQLYRDAFLLASRIVRSGYEPDVLIVVWRGGTPVGMVIHEYLAYLGVKPEHEVFKVVSYLGIESQTEPRVQHPDLVARAVPEGSRVLIVDDIFDSGRTIQSLVNAMGDAPAEVRVATPYYKPENNLTTRTPDYFVRETDNWIVFPHELVGLTAEEIQLKDPETLELLTAKEPQADGG